MRVSGYILFFIFLLILAAYLLPWVINPGVSLSPSGYDLAEWATIHPAALGENPPLLTGLLLRLPLACAAVALAFFMDPTASSRLLAGLMVLLMAVALLPPFEIVGDPGNWNYRQQLMLAGMTLLAGIFGLTGWFAGLRRFIGSGIAFVGAGAALLGFTRALAWMQAFDLPAYAGAGAFLTALLLLGLLAVGLRTGQRGVQHRPVRVSQH